jgi:hypothetical protein
MKLEKEYQGGSEKLIFYYSDGGGSKLKKLRGKKYKITELQ